MPHYWDVISNAWPAFVKVPGGKLALAKSICQKPNAKDYHLLGASKKGLQSTASGSRAGHATLLCGPLLALMMMS